MGPPKEKPRLQGQLQAGADTKHENRQFIGAHPDCQERRER